MLCKNYKLSAASHLLFAVSLALCDSSFSATSQSLFSIEEQNSLLHFLSAQKHYLCVPETLVILHHITC